MFQQLAYSTLRLSYSFKFQHLLTAPKAIFLKQLISYSIQSYVDPSMRCNFVRFLLAVKHWWPQGGCIEWHWSWSFTDVILKSCSNNSITWRHPLGLQQEDHQQNSLCQHRSLFSASLQCRLSSLRPRAEFRGEHLVWEGKSSSNLGSWDDRICSVVYICFFFIWAPFSGVLPQLFRLIVPGGTLNYGRLSLAP